MQYSVRKGAGCVYIPLAKFHNTDSVKPPHCFYNFPPSAFQYCSFANFVVGPTHFTLRLQTFVIHR